MAESILVYGETNQKKKRKRNSMAIILTDFGKQKALEYLVGKDTTTESLILKLYSNDISPANDDVLTKYTELPLTINNVTTGYASKTLTPATWTILDGTAVYPQQTWTFTIPAGIVYGYYVVLGTTGNLILAERFSSAPYSLATAGDVLQVTLNLTLI